MLFSLDSYHRESFIYVDGGVRDHFDFKLLLRKIKILPNNSTNPSKGKENYCPHSFP